MKIQVWDSFNFSETDKLFKELKKETPFMGVLSDESKELITNNVFSDTSEQKTNIPATTETLDDEILLSSEMNDATFLEKSLSMMCKRGGFHEAVLTDLDGLPISVFNSPVSDGVLAVYSAILGESLEKAVSMLDKPDANNISLDINTLDKIVLRKFIPNKTPYFLLVVSLQNIDERAEMEIAINQISQILH